MRNSSLVSINDFTKEEMLDILSLSKEFEKNPDQRKLNGKIIASLFFEPSTRTRLSFETAAKRLGGKVIGFSDSSSSSISKGESLKDTIKMVSSYSDLIIMRHPLEGSARYASEISSVPVINAGDGSNQHPTQTLLDLYSILKTQGRLEELSVAFVGDLKYGRTVHSLILALIAFKPVFYFVSHEKLRLTSEYKMMLDQNEIKYSEHNDIKEILNEVDILYMTRVQQERFSDPMEYEKVKGTFILKNKMLANSKRNLRILHPLPRVDEIHIDVDENEKAYYFEQALNGVYVRQAILTKVLNLL